MIIYTCITSKVDPLPEPVVVLPGCTYLCFSDTPWESSVWQVRPLLKQFESSILTARYHKTQVPLYLEDTKYLWQDGKVIMRDPTSLFQQLDNHDFLFFEHPVRACIYAEGKRVIELNKEKSDKINKQCERYKELGHVTEQLFETCVFLTNKNVRTVKLLTDWWEEIKTYSYRDQISLPFVLQNAKLHYKCLKDPYNQPCFNVNHHPIFERSVKFL